MFSFMIWLSQFKISTSPPPIKEILLTDRFDLIQNLPNEVFLNKWKTSSLLWWYTILAYIMNLFSYNFFSSTNHISFPISCTKHENKTTRIMRKGKLREDVPFMVEHYVGVLNKIMGTFGRFFPTSEQA